MLEVTSASGSVCALYAGDDQLPFIQNNILSLKIVVDPDGPVALALHDSCPDTEKKCVAPLPGSGKGVRMKYSG
jgi:hypothetical protein